MAKGTGHRAQSKGQKEAGKNHATFTL